MITMMMRKTVLAAAALVALAAPAFAADAPAPVRTILQRGPISGATGEEVVIASATFAPGAKLAWHTHPGEETGVVVSGVLILEEAGQPTQMLKAGQSYFIPRGTRHQASAAEDTHVVAVYTVDKDKPLATPAP
jgi:quercetin dioxygenase-like cupin family protein